MFSKVTFQKLTLSDVSWVRSGSEKVREKIF
jgi:hypothetical protein